MKLLRKYKVIFILITINFKLNCQYIPGIEQTDLYFDKLKSKNIGILCNNNSQLRDKHLIDSLIIYGTKIKKYLHQNMAFTLISQMVRKYSMINTKQSKTIYR